MSRFEVTAAKPNLEQPVTMGSILKVDGTFTPGPAKSGTRYRVWGLAVGEINDPKRRGKIRRPALWEWIEAVYANGKMFLALHGYGPNMEKADDGTDLTKHAQLEFAGPFTEGQKIPFNVQIDTTGAVVASFGEGEPKNGRTLLRANEGQEITLYLGMFGDHELRAPIGGVVEYEVTAE